MSIKHSLLALLAEQPTHGYGLKAGFEQHTATTWPLNVGQVYTTLRRLERDGLVAPESDTEDTAQKTWTLTDRGARCLEEWFAQPVSNDPPERDELSIKVLLAAGAGRADLHAILDAQRAVTMAGLQAHTRLKAKADPEGDLAWLLMLDALVVKAEAELRWLDLVELRLAERKAR